MGMQAVFKNIKGDRLIWAIAALLAIFSFLPVYSAASNLAYVSGEGNTFSFFIKHFMHLFLDLPLCTEFIKFHTDILEAYLWL